MHPQPGERGTYLDENGNLSGYTYFGSIVAGAVVILTAINYFVYYIYTSSIHKRGSKIALERNRMLAWVVVDDDEPEKVDGAKVL